MSLTVYALIPLLAAAASLALGVIVFRERRYDRLGKVFAALSIMLTAWNIHFVILYAVESADLALKLAAYCRWGSILLEPLVLHICLALRPRIPRGWRLVLAADYLLAGYLVVGDLRGQLVVGLQAFPWGFYSIGGPLYGAFSFSVFANFALATIAIASHHRASQDPTERLQLKFWLLGLVAALPLGLTNLFPAYGISFYPLGNLGNVLWASVIAYAIARHRLMAIEVVATKSIAYLLVGIGLLVPFVVLVTIMQQRVFGSVSVEFTILACILVMTGAQLFPRLRAHAESRIATSFVPDSVRNRAAIEALTRSIVRVFDQEKLIRQLVDGLHDALSPRTISVATLGQDKRSLDISYTCGAAPPSTSIPWLDPLVQHLRSTLHSLTRQEANASSVRGGRSELGDTFDQFDWEVALPLAANGNLIGLLGVGPRNDLRAYAAEDLALLDTLAAEAGVGLENARLNAELRRSRNLIQRADRSSALGVLAAGIAHEIRNPLVSIRTFFQLAPERLDDEEFMTSFLHTAASEVDRISVLINELLSFARSPTAKFDALDLAEIVEGTVVLVAPEARKRKVNLVVSKDEKPCRVVGNYELLRQASLNLVFNAIQATGAGGQVSITTRAVSYDGQAFGRLVVQDTGTGIAPSELDRIFDPFFTTKASGTGLGLSIVSQIAQEHLGRVAVESEPGQGSTFFLDVPTVAEPVKLSRGRF